MVLPPYDAKVIRCGGMSSLGAVHMVGKGFLQVLLEPFPQGPGCFLYVLLIAGQVLHTGSFTLLV